jgi:hypothetical protein
MITSRAVNDRVLLLEFLKLLRHLQIRSAELRPPAVVRLLADPQPSADIGHVHAIPKVNVSLPKQAHDLLCTASLLHQRTGSSPRRGARILSHDLDQDLGMGSGTYEPHRHRYRFKDF